MTPKYIFVAKSCICRIYKYLICMATWKNIYVTYMSKYTKYIFAKSCIIRIYFAYIFWDIFAKIYLTYIIPRPSKYLFAKSCIIRIYFAYIFWVISAKLYLTYIIPRPSKYIFMPKSCICRIYISFSWGGGGGVICNFMRYFGWNWPHKIFQKIYNFVYGIFWNFLQHITWKKNQTVRVTARSIWAGMPHIYYKRYVTYIYILDDLKSIFRFFNMSEWKTRKILFRSPNILFLQGFPWLPWHVATLIYHIFIHTCRRIFSINVDINTRTWLM